jgi:hypothetical protein
MELTRLNEDTDEETVLVEAPIVSPVDGVTIWWDTQHGDTTNSGYVAVGVPAAPLEGPPRCHYELVLEAEELGELLGYFPAHAIPAVVDRWLSHGNPETIGALAGRIIAHLARARSVPPEEQGGRSE